MVMFRGPRLSRVRFGLQKSDPDKAGFRLPLPRPEPRQLDENIDVEVLIVEASGEDDTGHDDIVLVGGG